MIDIQELQNYYKNDSVFITQHASVKIKERGIQIKDIRHAVETGIIIEQYENDFPFPSCLVLGKTVSGEAVHIVMSSSGTASNIITAYKPDTDKWEDGFRIRKEK